jgi:hypothetical protein
METVKEDNEYSSPPYRLLSFFQKSRNKWKAKARMRHRRIRQLEKRLLEVEASRCKWKAKARERSASSVVHDEQEKKGT